jgi:serine/threonine protein kinase
MSVVYQARQSSLNRRVALKVVRSGPHSNSQHYTRWLREARSLSRVRHENVVRLYQVGEANGWLYLVLELITGGTLQDRLDFPWEPRDGARLMEIVARAVAAIHREHILHLDLKPSNILLDGLPARAHEPPKPMVTDFGVAFLGNDPDLSDTAAGPLGTPRYMSPEQIDGDRSRIGPAADIYGLGAILYHLLTGHPPFAAASLSEMFDWIRTREPDPPRGFNPAIPRDLETICLKCLQKDPRRRYESAGSLADELSRWLDGRPILARPVSPLEKGWRWCRRRPMIAAFGAALALTLMISFFTVTLFWRRAEASFRLSNEVLSDLLDLSVGGEDRLPKVMTPDRLIPILDHNRSRLLALAASRRDDLLVQDQLALVERRLCECLIQARRYGDARTVLLDSLARLENSSRRQRDESTSAGADILYFLLADVNGYLGRKEDKFMYLARALTASEKRHRATQTPNTANDLFYIRRNFGLMLFFNGESERARSLFATNRCLVENPEIENDAVLAPALRLLAQVDWMLFIDGSRSTSAARTAADVTGALPPLARLTSPADPSQSPREWALIAAAALKAADADKLAAARQESGDSHRLMHRLGEIASLFRRNDEPEKARCVTARMLALGSHVVAIYSDEPAAHLALGQAYFQLSKDAWQTDDRSAAETYLKLALESAQQARLRDPQSEIAQQAMYNMQRRLVAINLSYRKDGNN